MRWHMMHLSSKCTPMPGGLLSRRQLCILVRHTMSACCSLVLVHLNVNSISLALLLSHTHGRSKSRNQEPYLIRSVIQLYLSSLCYLASSTSSSIPAAWLGPIPDRILSGTRSMLVPDFQHCDGSSGGVAAQIITAPRTTFFLRRNRPKAKHESIGPYWLCLHCL